MRAAHRRLAVVPLVAVCAACGAAARPTQPARPASPGQARFTEHCWWSTNRTALPPDSVTARFARAFAAVGFTGLARDARGDTAWVQSAPTARPSAPRGRTYAMHAVAYAVGDSTRFRYFLSLVGDAATNDTVLAAVIPVCTAVARAAAIPGVQPTQPTGEEGASVWRWRP